MKITVSVNVPDGEFCFGCDLWYRDEKSKRCYCLLFDMVELSQQYKANMTGLDIAKCAKCKEARP